MDAIIDNQQETKHFILILLFSGMIGTAFSMLIRLELAGLGI